jgi:magnesium chelatase family protein
MIRHVNLPPLSLDGWRRPVVLVGARGSGQHLWARWAREQVPPAEWCWWQSDSDHLFRLAGMLRELDARRAERTSREPPFRAPHHSCSQVGLQGTVLHGWRLKPGELSLATGGVLFLDEGAEFSHEALRSALAAAKRGTVELGGWGSPGEFCVLSVPAEFKLVIGMTPCPCGYLGDSTRGERCSCEVGAIHRHDSRIRWLAGEGCEVLREPAYEHTARAYAKELERRAECVEAK